MLTQDGLPTRDAHTNSVGARRAERERFVRHLRLNFNRSKSSNRCEANADSVEGDSHGASFRDGRFASPRAHDSYSPYNVAPVRHFSN